jgi:hypothetical protein
MDRDDAGISDRNEQARQGDTGMIGSESEEPGPGRDTSLTEPDPVAGGTEQPQTTVAMSEGDPMRTRLGSHVEGAGVIGYDVAAAEEGATQETPAEARPGYEAERPVGDAPMTTAPVAATAPLTGERDPDLAAEPVVDQGTYAQEAGSVGGEPVIDRSQDERTAGPGVGVAAAGEWVEDAGPSDRAAIADEPVAPERPAFATEDAGAADRSAVAADDPARFGAGDAMAGYQDQRASEAPATYTGEEADVTDRPEYADRSEGGDQALYQEEPQRMDRPGGGGSLFTDEEAERLDRPGPQEPGVQEGIYDQEADQTRRQRPSDGL